MSIIIFDTETSGLKGEVLQLSYMKVNEKTLVVEDFKSFYTDINGPIEQGAYDVHGIDKQQLEILSGGKYLEDYLKSDLVSMFSTDNILIGYNVGFDIGRIRHSLSFGGFELPMTASITRLKRESDQFCLAYDLLSTCRAITRTPYGNKLFNSVDKFVKPLVKDIDSNYDEMCNKFSIKRTGIGYHDASYDVYCTYLLLICLISTGQIINEL